MLNLSSSGCDPSRTSERNGSAPVGAVLSCETSRLDGECRHSRANVLLAQALGYRKLIQAYRTEDCDIRNFISSGAIIAVFVLGSAHAEENWGYCTRSTTVSPELRIRDCTDRINKFMMLVDDGESYMRRGQAYLDSGQYRLAIADYDLASAYGSQTIDALLQRGVAYALLGDFQHAEQDLEAALSWAEWAQRPPNDPLLVRVKLARGLLVAVKNGIQGPEVLRQVVEATVHQEK